MKTSLPHSVKDGEEEILDPPSDPVNLKVNGLFPDPHPSNTFIMENFSDFLL